MATNREEMIVQNLPLVSFVVSRMTGASGSAAFDREDALAYGTEGLIQAVDNYDSERGIPFASYAIQRIRGSILDATRRADLLPRTLRKTVRDFDHANLELAMLLGHWPTVKELALRLGLSVEQVKATMDHRAAFVDSLDRMMMERPGDDVGRWEPEDKDEYVDPAAATDRKAALQLLHVALGSLSARDRTIVKLRYAKAMPFHDIGRLMNISESRVCQLNKRIIANLRRLLEKQWGEAA